MSEQNSAAGAGVGADPVSLTFPVHWGEMDSLGHVNNARYFTWFESARIELFRRVGMESSGSPSLGPILAHTSCDFLVAVRWPALIEVRTWISGFGRTSFTMQYRADQRGDQLVTVARGTGVVVLIDYRDGSKVPIPDPLRLELERFTREP